MSPGRSVGRISPDSAGSAGERQQCPLVAGAGCDQRASYGICRTVYLQCDEQACHNGRRDRDAGVCGHHEPRRQSPCNIRAMPEDVIYLRHI